MATSYQPASKTRPHHTRQRFHADHIPVVAATGGGDCEGTGDGDCEGDGDGSDGGGEGGDCGEGDGDGDFPSCQPASKTQPHHARQQFNADHIPRGEGAQSPPPVAATTGGRLRRFDALVRYIRALLARQQGLAPGLRAGREHQRIFHNILYNRQLQTLSQRNRRNYRPLTTYWHDNCIILTDNNTQEGFIAMLAAITKREPIDPLSSQCPKLRKGV